MRTVLINVVAPYLVYILAKPRVGGFDALLLSAVPPTLESLVSVIQRRRFDLMAGLVLGGIAASLGLMALGGSERILLVRESLITGLLGLVFAGSVLAPKPVIYVLGRRAIALRDPDAAARWQQRWQTEPRFRRSMRVMSLVWGGGLLVEVAVRTVMAFDMRVSDFLLISPVVQYGLTGGLIVWTIWYARRRMRANAPPEPVAG